MYIKTFGSLDSERENGKTSNVTTRAYSRGQGPRDWFFSKLPALMANLKSKKRHFNSFCVCFSKNKKKCILGCYPEPVFKRHGLASPRSLRSS